MSSISKFAGHVLLHAKGAYEPQRKSNFALVIHDVDHQEDLILVVKDVDLPPTAFTQKSIKHFNETMHYAGSVTPFTDLTVNYHDYIDRQGLQAIAKWANQVWSPETGAIGWAKDYKKDGELLMLPPGIPGTTPGAVEAPAGGIYDQRKWKLEGLWVKSFKPDQFDHENDGDNTLLNVVISIDRAYPVSMK